MSDSAVSNSSCLIALEKIGRLDVLASSFASLTIPPAVQNEIGRNLDWLTVQHVQNKAAANTLKTQLGDGESEAIALAMEMQSADFKIAEALYKKALQLADEA